MKLNAKEMARNIAEMENFNGKSVILLGEMCELASALTEVGANVTTCEYREGTERNEDWNALPKMEKRFYEMEKDDVKGADFIIIASPQNPEYDAPLHAYEIAPAGCIVMFLFDKDHFGGKRSQYDVLLKNHGSSQSLGILSANEIAIALARLLKYEDGNEEFCGYLIDQKDLEVLGANGLYSAAMYDTAREHVVKYMESLRMYDETAKMMESLKDLVNFENNVDHMCDAFRIITDGFRYPHKDCRKRFKQDLREHYWEVILRKSSIFKFASRGILKKLDDFVNKHTAYPFTMRNVLDAISLLDRNCGEFMQQSLEEVFDDLTEKQTSKRTENGLGEKEPTNLGRRFVVDCMVDEYEVPYAKNVRLSNREFSGTILLEDFARILCWMTGKDYSSEDSLYRFACKNIIPWGEWFDWTFFRVKVYKKGTAHVEFKDEELLERFNRLIAHRRGYELTATPAKKVANRKAS